MSRSELTPEQLAEAVAAIERAGGNQSAAARDLGIDRNTLRHRLQRASQASVESDADERQRIRAAARQAELAAENTALKKQLENALADLEAARHSTGLRLPEKSRRRAKPKTYCRLVLADTHGSHADPEAIAAMLADIDRIDIREIVMLGDHLECGGFLANHHTLGYAAQIDETGYEDDIAATNDLLDRLQSSCPRATIHYIEGNHEHRIERWAVDQSVGNRANAEFLIRQVGPENVLRLANRGIHYYRQGERHMDIDVPGVIRLGKSYYTHGSLTRKHAAAGIADQFAGSVAYGHTHRADAWVTRFVNVGTCTVRCPGCLCVLQPRWRHNSPTTWTHGYQLETVNRADGTFHAIPVPIHRGRSYLQGLVAAMN